MIAGVFVGGAGTRMGGAAKGLMTRDGETLLARWQRVLGACGLDVVLVGERAEYAASGLAVVRDAPGDLGPLGGVIALLEHANGADVIAVACDMPFASEALVRKLIAAPPATVVAPREGARWQPFFARYAAAALPLARANAAARKTSLQTLLDAVAVELPLSVAERRELRDWDAPADVD